MNDARLRWPSGSRSPPEVGVFGPSRAKRRRVAIGLTAPTAAIDPSGSIEIFQTDGAYRSLGAGAGLAVTGGASTVKNVGDLAGPFLTGSITAAEGGGATANAFAGNSSNGLVFGGEAGLDVGFNDSIMGGINNSTPIGGVHCP